MGTIKLHFSLVHLAQVLLQKVTKIGGGECYAIQGGQPSPFKRLFLTRTKDLPPGDLGILADYKFIEGKKKSGPSLPRTLPVANCIEDGCFCPP